MTSRPRLAAAVSALACALVLAAAACTSSSEDATSVTSTDTACTPERTTFDAGTLTFRVVNRGSQPTELYVFGPDDEVISEVENVGPGTSRELTVDLGAGRYELGCKPGQTGDGIRAPITVTGAAKATKSADREVELTATDYAFGLADANIKVGETIRFEMRNLGKEPHEFEVFGPDGKVLGEIAEIKADASGSVTLSFDRPGTYRYICDVDDHQARGMKGTFTVSRA
jgi:plastocyanin